MQTVTYNCGQGGQQAREEGEPASNLPPSLLIIIFIVFQTVAQFDVQFPSAFLGGKIFLLVCQSSMFLVLKFCVSQSDQVKMFFQTELMVPYCYEQIHCSSMYI